MFCGQYMDLVRKIETRLQNPSFFFYHILITQTYETKKYYNHQVLFYISSTWGKGKKISEIEIKMIIKMKNIIYAQLGK